MSEPFLLRHINILNNSLGVLPCSGYTPDL